MARRLIEQALTIGAAVVCAETIPLTVNARTELPAVLERLKEPMAC